jgi:predicted RNA-binding protein with PUA-like domain
MEVIMNYWIFKANPAIYDVEASIRQGKYPDRWKVSRYSKEIRRGDVVFLWITGNPRGIIAMFETTTDPYYIPPNPVDPYWSDTFKVDLHLLSHFPKLDAEFLKTVPGLQSLSMFHGFQAATNFKVTEQEGEIIRQLIGPA